VITSVQSAASLTKALADHFGKLRATGQRLARPADEPLRNAIFAIHGISPIQRYAFQDQVAVSLQSYLNAIEQLSNSHLTWKSIVHWPFATSRSANPEVQPSALRIYRSDDDPKDPARTVFDVYEGYWSPLSKGRTNATSALQWLLKSLFLPYSSTANIPCTKQKLYSDLGYIGGILALLVILGALTVAIGLYAWAGFVHMLLPTTSQVPSLQLLIRPFDVIAQLPLLGYVELLVDIAAAYLLMQLITNLNLWLKRSRRTAELSKDEEKPASTFRTQTISAKKFHHWATFILLLLFLALVGGSLGIAAIVGHFKTTGVATFAVYAILVAAAVGCFTLAKSLANFAVENVLGDIQIYTTHDDNSTFHAIRTKIIETVSSSLLGVLRAVPQDATPNAPPYYSSVHIFGHSLGSTIGMDVLINLRQMVQEGLLSPAQWSRMRSFTTFGTALEKTRFFFDVRQPSINAAQDQWENDVYGRFFTDSISTLSLSDNRDGIYWSNVWYLRDIVANAIVSYRSDVPAGAQSFEWTSASRQICTNYEVPHERPRFAWVHSDYLNDPLFWEKAAPVVASP
jgi:hypothetical protein